MKSIITFDDFSKLDLRVGKVVHCERKEGSEKLLRLKVDFGEEGERNILSGLAQWYQPEDLVDKEFIFIINLEPRKIMGEESQGMILAADAAQAEKPVPLKPKSKVPAGAPIR
jgi:methionine--tRNA ligase beta chain